MTNHSILDNYRCPACGSDDFEVVGDSADPDYFECEECGMEWEPDDVSGDHAPRKPLDFE